MQASAPYFWHKWDGVIPKNLVYTSEYYAVIKGYYDNEWIPGKFHTTDLKAYVPWSGKEHQVETFELLVHADNAIVEWHPLRDGEIPLNAVGPLGFDGLYVGKAVCPHPESKLTPGKIHPKNQRFYLSWGGKEIDYEAYEALSIRHPVVPVFEEVITITTVTETSEGHHHHHHHEGF